METLAGDCPQALSYPLLVTTSTTKGEPMTTTTTEDRAALDRSVARLQQALADQRAEADEIASEGTPEARRRAGVLRCQATKSENIMGFVIDMCDIGLHAAAAKWCPNGPYRRPAGWTAPRMATEMAASS